MSAGTKVTTVRIPAQLRAECLEYLECRSALACVTPWSMTDLILVALAEKMRHIQRSNRRKRKVLKLAEIAEGLSTIEPIIETQVEDNYYEVAP